MSAALKPYIPRPGSSAELAMEHLTTYGPTAHTALADAIDVEARQLYAGLRVAEEHGAVRRFERGGVTWWKLGNGEPPTQAATQEAPPKPNTPRLDSQHVLKAEAARPDATDRETPANASPGGSPMGAGQPAAAGPTGGVDTDAVQRRMTLSLEVTMHEAEMIFSVLRCAGRAT